MKGRPDKPVPPNGKPGRYREFTVGLLEEDSKLFAELPDWVPTPLPEGSQILLKCHPRSYLTIEKWSDTTFQGNNVAGSDLREIDPENITGCMYRIPLEKE